LGGDTGAGAAGASGARGGSGFGSAVARPSVAERKAELWYPNAEGKPIDLWKESRLIERDAQKKRAR
jgi:hypothetical protein